jgi:thiamine biosynthesis lipoprotein
MPQAAPPQPTHGDAEDLGFEFTAMATVCSLRLAGLAEPHARALAQQAIAEVRRIEHKYSRYRADSLLSRINQAAGSGAAIEVDEETAHLLDFAAQIHALSDGLFDITSGSLRRAWDFKSGRLPAPDQLAAILPCIGWQQVHWSGQRIALPRAGMEIDFGGIGKEYATDRVATLLAQAGVTSGVVNFGGDLRVLGPQPDGQAWSVGIGHPRHAGALVARIQVMQGALATSGDSERFFELDGRRYCHILNPRTGWPVAHWQSVSVVAPVCLAAGALTTIAMLMEDRAPEFLREQGVGFLMVDREGSIQQESV